MREDQEKRRFARPEGNASPYALRNFVHDGRGTVGKERAIKINSRQGQETELRTNSLLLFFLGLRNGDLDPPIVCRHGLADVHCC